MPLADHSSCGPYVMGAHGCFAYKLADGQKVNAIYFDVLPDPAAALYASLEQLEGFRGLSQLISMMKQRLLGESQASQFSDVVSSRNLATCIEQTSGKSAKAVSHMLAEYVRAVADLQMESCSVCAEAYGAGRPRLCFRVCKHTACEDCAQRLERCPLCNVQHPPPKLADGWLTLLDKPEELANAFLSRDINIAELWWQDTRQ